MTIAVKHDFISAKADGVDTTLVQPSAWNANHDITLAAGFILGRDASAGGAVQELPLSFDTAVAGNPSFDCTGYMLGPVGSTSQRPGSPTTGMFRYNTTRGVFEGYLAAAWADFLLPTLASFLQENKNIDVASTSATDLSLLTGNLFYYTGNATVVTLGIVQAGAEVEMILTGHPTFTHDPAVLICLNGANVIGVAGDIIRWRSLGANVWQMMSLTRTTGAPLTSYQAVYSNWMTNDLLVNVINTDFIGPTVIQPNGVGSGLYECVGSFIWNNLVGGSHVTYRLWDGATVIDSGGFGTNSADPVYRITLQGTIKDPAGNIRISVQCSNSTGNKVLFNYSTYSKDSGLTVKRIG